MFEWVEQIWQQKDQLITDMLADFESNDSGNKESEVKDNIKQA